MQNYPNFQPQMPPYQPMYGQPTMMTPQVQSPYMDRLSQLQSMQQSLQQPQPHISGLNGRVVEVAENILASDVPMDGSFAVFPKRDLSEVYVKYWTGEGKIATINFKPISEAPADISTTDTTSLRFDELSNVLGGLYDKVDKLSSRIDEVLKSKTSQRSKERSES